MDERERKAITGLLHGLPEAGETESEEAWRVLYREILRIARAQRRRWEGDWTMETRALANEVYLKVFGSDSRDFGDRRHFYRLIGKAIRHLLINYAEERRAAKRGGGADHVPLEEAFGLGLSPKAFDQARELHRALERLQAVDARAAEVVQLKFFVGLKNAEIGEVLEVSKATVARDWTFARAWLWREMGAESGAIGEVGPGPEPV